MRRQHRMMLSLCLNLKAVMRTTIALDDELVAKAEALTGLAEKASLIREALKALIERESALRLTRLGGTEPHISVPQFVVAAPL